MGLFWEFGSHTWLLPCAGPSFPEQLLLGPGNSGPILSSSLMWGPHSQNSPFLLVLAIHIKVSAFVKLLISSKP